MKNLRIIVLSMVFLLFVTVAAVQAKSRAVGRGTVKELATGAALHGSNGMAIDEQGNLYIASVLGQEIIVMDPRTGRILDRIGSDEGVVGPDDLTFGPDGSLYWTDILSGEVGRLAPDGEVTKQFVAPFVNPITFSDDGRLFVAQAFVDDGLYEVDPALEAPPIKILGEGNPAYHLNAMDFGPDGMLYAPRQQLGHTVRIDVDTGEIELLTDELHGACKFDSQGRLHIGTTNQVVRFDTDSGEVTVIATLPGEGADNIVFDAQDRLFVSNFRDGSVFRVLPNGRVRQLSGGGMVSPGGIAVIPNDQAGEILYVADFWSVRSFDGRTGKAGDVDNDFFFDAPVSASPDGENVLLTSWFGNTVTVWSPETHTKLEVHGGFNAPLNAIRFQGDIIVAELGSGKLIRQDGNGIRTELVTDLVVPAGLAATDDDMWVAEWATGNIWQVIANNETLASPILTASGLVQPEGLAVDLDGSLLVVESGAGRLMRIDPATGNFTLVAEDLAFGISAPEGWPPTWIFNGVAVGQRGAIYVTGDIGDLIYRIQVRN